MVRQSVVEFATLGFVGLVIETINTGRGGKILGEISASFLGEEELLIERFEELHQGLFDVTIVYFAACTFLILRITAQYAEASAPGLRRLPHSSHSMVCHTQWDAERRSSYLDFKLAEYDWKQGANITTSEQKFALRGWNEVARKMEMTRRSRSESYRQGLLGSWLKVA